MAVRQGDLKLPHIAAMTATRFLVWFSLSILDDNLHIFPKDFTTWTFACSITVLKVTICIFNLVPALDFVIFYIMLQQSTQPFLFLITPTSTSV